MSMHIEAGHPAYGEVKKLTENIVRFVTEDGRAMFEVSPGKDGKSLEVRGVGWTKVDKQIYTELLDVRPNVANSITVMVRPYMGSA